MMIRLNPCLTYWASFWLAYHDILGFILKSPGPRPIDLSPKFMCNNSNFKYSSRISLISYKVVFSFF